MNTKGIPMIYIWFTFVLLTTIYSIPVYSQQQPSCNSGYYFNGTFCVPQQNYTIFNQTELEAIGRLSFLANTTNETWISILIKWQSLNASFIPTNLSPENYYNKAEIDIINATLRYKVESIEGNTDAKISDAIALVTGQSNITGIIDKTKEEFNELLESKADNISTAQQLAAVQQYATESNNILQDYFNKKLNSLTTIVALGFIGIIAALAALYWFKFRKIQTKPIYLKESAGTGTKQLSPADLRYNSGVKEKINKQKKLWASVLKKKLSPKTKLELIDMLKDSKITDEAEADEWAVNLKETDKLKEGASNVKKKPKHKHKVKKKPKHKHKA